jgi:transcriptional regulator with XRE-family HTH domain
MTPSGKQIRAARALAGWERTDLAKKSGLSSVTIRYVENETSAAKKETIEKIVSAFRLVGIEFIENDGVRRLPMSIEIFEGPERFEDFMTYLYEYLEKLGGEVCIYIQDESLLGHTRKNIEAHRARMAALVKSGRVYGRILAAKGVEKSDWAEIRRMPFHPDTPQVSFHTFGDNLALISFDHPKPPYVVLHKSGPFAAVYKDAFNAAWEKTGEK